MVSATLSDIVRRYKAPKFGSKEAVRTTFEDFPDKVSVEKLILYRKILSKKYTYHSGHVLVPGSIISGLSLRFQVARGLFLKSPNDFLSLKLNNIRIKNNVKNDSARSS